MAVFKDENGVWKPGGYPYGRIKPRNPQGGINLIRGISQYPQFYRVCVRRSDRLNNMRNVRAGLISLDGFVRKGGGCKK